MEYLNLINWIRDNGGYIDPDLVIKNENEERYVELHSEKIKNTLLFRIPKKCIIYGENILQLCGKLILEMNRGEKSFFYPYIKILPSFESFKNHPLVKYNESDLEKIKEISLEAHKHLASIFAKLKMLKLFYSGAVSNDTILYSTLLVYTRAWGEGFYPFFDMLQHSNDKKDISMIKEENGDIIVNSENILKKGEIFNFYRYGSLAEFYIYYGIPKLNCNNLILDIELPNLGEMEKKSLESLGLYSVPIQFYFSDTELNKETILKSKIVSGGENPLEIERNTIKFLLQVLDKVKYKTLGYDYDKYKDFYKINNTYCDIVQKSKNMLLNRWLELVK